MSLLMLICGAGATFGLTEAEIAEPIRRMLGRWDFLDRMLACPYCTGFYVGCLVGLSLYLPGSSGLEGYVSGYASHTVAFLIARDVFLMGVGTGITAMVSTRIIDMGDASVHSAAFLASAAIDTMEEDIMSCGHSSIYWDPASGQCVECSIDG